MSLGSMHFQPEMLKIQVIQVAVATNSAAPLPCHDNQESDSFCATLSDTETTTQAQLTCQELD